MSPEWPKVVLVVDDEADVRRYLEEALTDAGFRVETAEDGLQALEKVRRNPPDLISLDLVMPRHSGAKFYHELRKDKLFSRIPVLIVTGHARDDLGRADFEEMTMSGPGVYLEKPVHPDTYVAAVRRLLGMESAEAPEPQPEDLGRELSRAISDADREALQEALDVLRRKKGNEMKSQKIILVVEDEPDQIAYLEALFSDHGYTVITAENGREGFAKAKSNHPDLITLDISMPEESGVRMFRDLQAESATSNIPVIIITGVTHDFKRFIESRKQLRPPQGYFDKPLDREALLAKISELLGTARTQT